jgi:CheY-like chemotaxis protein
MSLVLLADDSPHAQRMGERILREEGFEVLTALDGETALRLIDESDPDVIVADVFLPGVSGVDLCRRLKSNDKQRHIRIVLTAGLLEPFDEEESRQAGCDAIIKKPFEATAIVDTLKPLAEAAQFARGLFGEPEPPEPVLIPHPLNGLHRHALNPAIQVDPEQIRAAITIALDHALPAMIEEITERVLVALGH